jgi:sulfur-carrier protein
MTITIRIPTQLRNLTGGNGEVAVVASTVGGALDELRSTHDGIGERLFDDTGSLRRFVNVFLGEEDVRFLSGLSTEVASGQTISIVPAVAGG